jgi:hypothetical protein
MKVWNWFLVLMSGVILAGSLYAVLKHWQYDFIDPNIVQMMKQDVTDAQVKQLIEQAIKDNNPEDARMYLSIAQTFGYAIKPDDYAAQLAALDSPYNQAKRTLNDFTTGFIDGKGESGVGVAGAITSDFTVVGDARDLWEQYQLYAQGKPVNELVVALAGVGVGLTAATIVSAGSASPVKGGVSTAKLASRAGHITPSFQKVLMKQAGNVFDYKSFLVVANAEKSMDGISKAAIKAYNPAALKSLQTTADSLNTIRKSSSTADAVHMLKYVDNADDLVQLEKITVKYGSQTKGIVKVLGKGALRSVKVLRRTTELMISLIASLISGFASLISTYNLIRSSKRAFSKAV